MKSLTSRLACLVLMCFVCGCGDSAPDGGVTNSEDPTALELVSLLQRCRDAARDPKEFATLFLTDAVPESDIEKFENFLLVPSSPPKFEGDTATMQVKVKDETDASTMMEWSFKKEGGAWKFDKTPFP